MNDREVEFRKPRIRASLSHEPPRLKRNPRISVWRQSSNTVPPCARRCLGENTHRGRLIDVATRLHIFKMAKEGLLHLAILAPFTSQCGFEERDRAQGDRSAQAARMAKERTEKEGCTAVLPASLRGQCCWHHRRRRRRCPSRGNARAPRGAQAGGCPRGGRPAPGCPRWRFRRDSSPVQGSAS